jgi:hypothetical protein
MRQARARATKGPTAGPQKLHRQPHGSRTPARARDRAAPTLKHAMYSPMAAPRCRGPNRSTTRRIPGM